MKYYLENAKEVLSQTQSSEKGLSSAEAAKRLEKNGKNKLKEAEKESLFRKFINSLADPMIIMLLVAERSSSRALFRALLRLSKPAESRLFVSSPMFLLSLLLLSSTR